MRFPDFDADAFLRDYWQKRPLLIRNPWNAWCNPIEPDELAGLACEPGIESRLITLADRQANSGWQVEPGPVPEDRFEKLGTDPWTLLVQAVDHQVPAVAALIEPFRFVPNWRIDDVMVSYASDGGGVGPHFDHYDVFLIQGLGRRRWRLGQMCDADTELLPHDDLRLLAHFEPTEEWILEPGDILYVPPRLSHDGAALGDDCMTYSVGFRAPGRSELVAHWCEHVLESIGDDDRYEDPDLVAPANPGEIAPAALERLQAMVLEKMRDPSEFARWFGEYTSTPKYPEVDWRPEEYLGEEALRALIARAAPLIRNPASRFAFVRQDAGPLLLFVDGECFECAGETAQLAEALCAGDCFEIDAALAESDEAMALITALYDQGSIAFEDED